MAMKAQMFPTLRTHAVAVVCTESELGSSRSEDISSAEIVSIN